MEVINIFDAMGIYWAEIADNHSTEKQIHFLINQLKEQRYVLDLACGTGRHTIPLKNEGYKIVGLDASVNLLKIGKKRDGDTMLVCGDMRFLPFNEASFSAVISMDTSVGYLPTEKEDVEIMSNARRVLRRDGVFIVDVFNSPNLSAKYGNKTPSIKNVEYPSFHLRQKRQLSRDGKFLCDEWTIHRIADGETRVFNHIVRLYDVNKLGALLELAGFIVKRVFGGYEGQDFSADSLRLIVVAALR